jgi:hypothetical protein
MLNVRYWMFVFPFDVGRSVFDVHLSNKPSPPFSGWVRKVGLRRIKRRLLGIETLYGLRLMHS